MLSEDIMAVSLKTPCTQEQMSGKICWLNGFAEDHIPTELQDDILICKDCPTFKETINRAFGRRTADQTLGRTIARLLMLVSERTYRLQETSIELKSKVEELALIKTITEAVVKTTDIHKALKIILTGVTSGRAFGFNRAGIFLVDERHEYLLGKHAVGPKNKQEALEIWNRLTATSLNQQIENILDESPVETDYLHKRVEKIKIPLTDEANIFIRALAEENPRIFRKGLIPSELENTIRAYFDFNEFVIIPLKAEGPSLGLLVADNYYSGQPITESTIDALYTLAVACTTLLENTLLHSQLSLRLKELEQVNRLLRENQNYLIRTERLADIGKLATTVAHEFRTPLVTIGGFARRMLRTIKPGNSGGRELKIIASEVDRLEMITGELLEYSRQVKLDLKPRNLNDLVRHSLELMEGQLTSGGIKLKTKFSRDNIYSRLDDRRFSQVIFNIVGNAIEAMNRGGMLTVSTRLDNDFVILEISDNGCGIDVDDKSQLFNLFFTTKSRGSGLGLPISKKIVEDHGGYIKLESSAGEGACFSLFFPRFIETKENAAE